MTTHKKAYMAALLYTLIIGFSFIFVKIALTEASPLDTLSHRFTIAFVFATIPIFTLILATIFLKEQSSI